MSIFTKSQKRRMEQSKFHMILLAMISSDLVYLSTGFSKLLPTNSVNQFGIRYSQTQLHVIFGTHKKFTRVQNYNEKKSVACQMIYAPPNSGYQTPDEEELFLPETYEPTMEFPGTMRPGRTAENMPLHDLPIGDNDPDPIPWPHFQEIDWYHQWPSPHPHPIPMDEFIEMNGRWATLEDEAEMRRDARRGVRERREAAEKEKTSHQVMDDTDDDDDDDDKELGDGVADILSAATGIDTDVNAMTKKQRGAIDVDVEDSNVDDTQAIMEEEEEDDDFLLELGLDLDDDDDDNDNEDDDIDDDEDDDDGDAPAYSSDDSSDLLRAMQGLIDMDKIDDSDTEEDDDDNDDDLDINFDFNDDDDDSIVDDEDNSGVKVVPIENLNDADELDDNDDITYDDDNEYDDGGFDLDIDDEFGGEIDDDDYADDDDDDDDVW